MSISNANCRELPGILAIVDGIPAKSGAEELKFHDNGRLRELRLARSHSVAGRCYDRGTLLRFDRDGHLIYAQP
ncbi:MAG TPA: hypothetical protein VNO18_13505 [Xanthobacteraceae bacterium]|nr:hypothetical protein [Xanthobacteraceae bacterium]